MSGGERLGDQVRLVARVELVAEIFDVALDRPRRDSELQSTLFRGQPSRDALQNLPLTVGQADEILLLTRKIHHLVPWSGKTLFSLNSLSYHGLTDD